MWCLQEMVGGGQALDVARVPSILTLIRSARPWDTHSLTSWSCLRCFCEGSLSHGGVYQIEDEVGTLTSTHSPITASLPPPLLLNVNLF